MSRADILRVWDRYSEDMCAGYMGLPETDEDLLDVILRYSE